MPEPGARFFLEVPTLKHGLSETLPVTWLPSFPSMAADAAPVIPSARVQARTAGGPSPRRHLSSTGSHADCARSPRSGRGPQGAADKIPNKCDPRRVKHTAWKPPRVRGPGSELTSCPHPQSAPGGTAPATPACHTPGADPTSHLDECRSWGPAGDPFSPDLCDACTGPQGSSLSRLQGTA